MNTYNKSLFLVVFSALCIWSIAQTSQSAEQKAEGENATNNGVTITQGPGASIPEGPEPQGGWFTPLYTVGGVVKSEYYDKAEETFVSQGESPFSVSLGSDNRWQMSLVNYWDDSKEKTTTNFVAYDGTNIFTALYSKYYLDTKTFSAVEKKKIMGAPTIGKGPFPIHGTPAMGLLWVAFLSGDYLRGGDTNRIPNLLLSDLDTDPTAWCADFRTRMLENSSNPLVKEGFFELNKDYISDDLMDYPNVEEPMSERSAFVLSEILNTLKDIEEDRFLSSHYILSDSIKMNEITIPKEFRSSFYTLPKRDEKAYLCGKRTGTITNVTFNAKAVPMIPQMEGSQIVRDTRFMFKDEHKFRNTISYFVTNQWELSMDDIEREKADRLYVGSRGGYAPRGKSNYGKLIAIAALILIPFIIGIIKIAFSRNRKIQH
jgi:hypothetical protein